MRAGVKAAAAAVELDTSAAANVPNVEAGAGVNASIDVAGMGVEATAAAANAPNVEAGADMNSVIDAAEVYYC